MRIKTFLRENDELGKVDKETNAYKIIKKDENSSMPKDVWDNDDTDQEYQYLTDDSAEFKFQTHSTTSSSRTKLTRLKSFNDQKKTL